MIIDNEKTIRFGQFFHTKCRRRYVREHDTIKNAIGAHFQSLGYEAIYEWCCEKSFDCSGDRM